MSDTLTLDFDGATFVPELDGERLGRQLLLVRGYLLRVTPEWRTLNEISEDIDEPEASVSARIRDLKKPKFGGWDGYVQKKRRGDKKRGYWEYRINPECLR